MNKFLGSIFGFIDIVIRQTVKVGFPLFISIFTLAGVPYVFYRVLFNMHVAGFKTPVDFYVIKTTILVFLVIIFSALSMGLSHYFNHSEEDDDE